MKYVSQFNSIIQSFQQFEKGQRFISKGITLEKIRTLKDSLKELCEDVNR